MCFLCACDTMVCVCVMGNCQEFNNAHNLALLYETAYIPHTHTHTMHRRTYAPCECTDTHPPPNNSAHASYAPTYTLLPPSPLCPPQPPRALLPHHPMMMMMMMKHVVVLMVLMLYSTPTLGGCVGVGVGGCVGVQASPQQWQPCSRVVVLHDAVCVVGKGTRWDYLCVCA